MPKPQRPTNAVMENGWYIEIAGLVSPRFETLSGLRKSTGIVEVVDAGSNIKHKFLDQIRDFGQISLSRNMDNSVDDLGIETLTELCQTTGLQLAGILVKLHWNTPIWSIGFDGLSFFDFAYSDLNINSSEKLMNNIQATVNTWLRVPI